MGVLASIERAGLELPPSNTSKPAKLKRICQAGNTLYLSGTGPWHGAKLLFSGKLGQDMDQDAGYQAACATALNQIRILIDAGYDVDRIRWVKVNGFINCAPDFQHPSEVLNGFTDVIVEAFGEERGLSARTACGVASIPWNMPLEVEAVCVLESAA